MNHHDLWSRIAVVKAAFDAAGERVVFVGGAVVALYADRPVLAFRPTEDIDVLVEILNYSARSHLEERLRQAGFRHDVASGLTCRYSLQGITVDVMPTDDPSIGFSCDWYSPGFHNATDIAMPGGQAISLLSAPYFLASKLEAFKGRGRGDGRTSPDFEDIVFLFENRSVIWDELAATEEPLRDLLKRTIGDLVRHPQIKEWIDAHVERNTPRATENIINQMMMFIKA